MFVKDAIEAIEKVFNGDYSPMKEHKWLMLLWCTEENQFNPEHVQSLMDTKHTTLKYVFRTLLKLQKIVRPQPNVINIPEDWEELITEVLVWSEVTKCGNKYYRNKWKDIDLNDHALASAKVYEMEMGEKANKNVINHIKAHGNLGQYIKGEMSRDALYMFTGDINNREKALFIAACTISAVSEDLWTDVLEKYLPLKHNFFRDTYSAADRVKMLCNTEFDVTLSAVTADLVDKCDLWYAKAVFEALGTEKTIKLLTYISEKHVGTDTRVLNFKDMLDKMYYYPNNERTIDYCAIAMINEAIDGNDKHCKIKVINNGNSLNIGVNFSSTGLGINSFYRNVNHDDIHHRKAVLMMLDYFGYRSDSFDRLGNEKDYLQTMNSSIDDKTKILEYINMNDSVLEVGPGGGALMKLISRITPDVSCIDISKEVCNRLEDIAKSEGYPWNIIYGDFFTMDASEKYDKIVFCSNIHEMFSFIEYDGKKFNKEIISAIILKAKDLLNDGGQIIIRDGIASDDNSDCIVTFRDDEMLRFFHEYRKHFKGFELNITDISDVEFRMPYNSMMESLYTITWGEDSLPFEIEEWYGYFSPSEWKTLSTTVGMKMERFEKYLQKGYKTHLKGKVDLNGIEFPDSNCFIVLQK